MASNTPPHNQSIPRYLRAFAEHGYNLVTVGFGRAFVMPAPLINDPKHWRDRAEEARAVAVWMSDEQARLAMLKIAEGYDHLAELAELRSSEPLPADSN
jgi:hypothetical protein